MKWKKVDHNSGQEIAHNSGWHIPDYVSGNFRIINNSGSYTTTCNGHAVGTYNTLREAKARAEALEPLADFI
jgi:hypothetical protein